MKNKNGAGRKCCIRKGAFGYMQWSNPINVINGVLFVVYLNKYSSNEYLT